jgi:NAD-dependent deacetylase
MLPQAEWAAALTAAEDCDFFLSIGTSGVVYPAAELPMRAFGQGAVVVHVNPVSFEVSSQEFFLKGTAAQKLTELLASAFG